MERILIRVSLHECMAELPTSAQRTPGPTYWHAGLGPFPHFLLRGRFIRWGGALVITQRVNFSSTAEERGSIAPWSEAPERNSSTVPDHLPRTRNTSRSTSAPLPRRTAQAPNAGSTPCGGRGRRPASRRASHPAARSSAAELSPRPWRRRCPRRGPPRLLSSRCRVDHGDGMGGGTVHRSGVEMRAGRCPRRVRAWCLSMCQPAEPLVQPGTGRSPATKSMREPTAGAGLELRPSVVKNPRPWQAVRMRVVRTQYALRPRQGSAGRRDAAQTQEAEPRRGQRPTPDLRSV